MSVPKHYFTDFRRAIDCAKQEMERLFAAHEYDQARGAGIVFRALLRLRGTKENVVQFPKRAQR